MSSKENVCLTRKKIKKEIFIQKKLIEEKEQELSKLNQDLIAKKQSLLNCIENDCFKLGSILTFKDKNNKSIRILLIDNRDSLDGLVLDQNDYIDKYNTTDFYCFYGKDLIQKIENFYEWELSNIEEEQI